MSNNLDKLNQVQDVPEQFRSKQSNPFSFLKETMFISLPSGGKYYDDPKLSSGEVELYFMDARHEDILSNKNYIKKGLMVDKFLDAILVDDIPTENLLGADRTAIMFEARKAAYGDSYEAQITCPACGTTTKDEVSLNDVHVTPGDVVSGVTITPEKKVRLKLPEASRLAGRDFYIEMEMTNGAHERKMQKILDRPDSGFKDILQLLVCDVDGHTEPNMIEKFLRLMRAKDSLFVKENYKKACPFITITHHFVCSNTSCNNTVEDMEVGITANFFWPKL